MGLGGSKNKKLLKEDLDFLLGNTNFTKKQIKQWYKGFMVSKTKTIILDLFFFWNLNLRSSQKFSRNSRKYFYYHKILVIKLTLFSYIR